MQRAALLRHKSPPQKNNASTQVLQFCMEIDSSIVSSPVCTVHLNAGSRGGEGRDETTFVENTALAEMSSLTSVRHGEVGGGALEPQEQDKSQDKDAVTM